jgi:hypothetical protein
MSARRRGEGVESRRLCRCQDSELKLSVNIVRYFGFSSKDLDSSGDNRFPPVDLSISSPASAA